jgi:hypothetical protein
MYNTGGAHPAADGMQPAFGPQVGGLPHASSSQQFGGPVTSTLVLHEGTFGLARPAVGTHQPGGFAPVSLFRWRRAAVRRFCTALSSRRVTGSILLAVCSSKALRAVYIRPSAGGSSFAGVAQQPGGFAPPTSSPLVSGSLLLAVCSSLQAALRCLHLSRLVKGSILPAVCSSQAAPRCLHPSRR